jgi:hypothetical protein
VTIELPIHEPASPEPVKQQAGVSRS